MQYPHHFELAIGPSLAVLVLISDEIIMQRLGACNFLKCSSNTLIPINYVMGSSICSPCLPTVLKLMQRNINLKQQEKTHGCDENDLILTILQNLQYTGSL